MREIVGILERKDTSEYLRLAKKALKVRRILAIFRPALTGVVALGSATTPAIWAVMLAIIAMLKYHTSSRDT
jgi:hypothetical protein